METYDKKTAELIERSYQTPEIVNQRLRTLAALALARGSDSAAECQLFGTQFFSHYVTKLCRHCCQAERNHRGGVQSLA
jgi:hypothetical protein